MPIIDLIGRAIRGRISHGLPIFNEEPSQRRHALQLPMDGAMAVFGGEAARVLATTHGINDHPFDFVTLSSSPIQHELQMARCMSPDAPTLEILDDDMEEPNGDKTTPRKGPCTPPGSPPHSPTCTPGRMTLRTPPNVDTDETIWSGDDDLWCTIDEWEGESLQFFYGVTRALLEPQEANRENEVRLEKEFIEMVEKGLAFGVRVNQLTEERQVVDRVLCAERQKNKLPMAEFE